MYLYMQSIFPQIQVSTNIIFFAVKTKEGIKMYKVKINICADCSQSNLWISKTQVSKVQRHHQHNNHHRLQQQTGFPFLFAKHSHAKR